MTPDKIPADHDIDHAIDTGADEPIDPRLEEAADKLIRRMDRAKVCHHGYLRRSCERCDYADEIARLRALLRDAGEVLDSVVRHNSKAGARVVLARIREELEEA